MTKDTEFISEFSIGPGPFILLFIVIIFGILVTAGVILKIHGC